MSEALAKLGLPEIWENVKVLGPNGAWGKARVLGYFNNETGFYWGVVFEEHAWTGRVKLSDEGKTWCRLVTPRIWPAWTQRLEAFLASHEAQVVKP